VTVVVPTNNLFIPKIKTHISSTLHHSRKRTEKTRTKRKKKKKASISDPTRPPLKTPQRKQRCKKKKTH
jgi:hypothetical protein